MSEDLLAQKRERLAKLKADAAKKKKTRDAANKTKNSSSKGQGGKADDVDDYLNKVTSSAFDERKQKEEEDDQDSPQPTTNSNLVIAMDQCEVTIAPIVKQFIEQEVQVETGKKKLDAQDSEEEVDLPQRNRAESLNRRPTIATTNVNGMNMVADVGPAPPAEEKEVKEEKIEAPKIMSKDEAKAVQQSSEFMNFFMKAARLVERGLYSEEDVIGSFERLEVKEGEKNTTKYTKLIEKATFLKDNPIKRAITNLDWSTQHKELFLCSYYVSENEWDTSEPEGLVNIFSTQMPSQPEITLTCQSQITSCIFHPIEPHLVIGGTFSGSVIIWDLREKKNFPVVKTPTSDSSIKSIKTFIKDNHYNNIISVANNGRVCVWTTNMMKEPQKTIDLVDKTNPLTVHCIDLPEGETNQFYVGSEDSNIYSAKIHTKSDKETNLGDKYEGHMGTVFSLNYHPLLTDRKSEISQLMLSTGADWRLGLWHPKVRKEPLFMYEGDCEIYDAKWSPVHPTVFATCNGAGQIDLWDVSKETEDYRYRYDADKRAINKLKWSNDGRRLISGNTSGTIKLWSVNKDFYQYNEEDIAKFEKQLAPSSSFGDI